MSDFTLALPFDTDDPEFRRGVETGLLWEAARRDKWADATVHADLAEMVIRIAEAFGLPFTAEPLDDSWLHVTIGEPELTEGP